MSNAILHGSILTFSGDPFRESLEDAVRVSNDALLIEDDVIKALGSLDAMRAQAPDARVHDYQGKLICPGFVDAHAHYPQTGIIASWGKRLIDWLNGYTFPEEARFGDAGYAENVAGQYLDLLLDHGTTSAASFCTIHPESVDALFEAAAARGMAIASGKTCMDRNAPENLRDTAQSAYDDSRDLLRKWHGKGRCLLYTSPSPRD